MQRSVDALKRRVLRWGARLLGPEGAARAASRRIDWGNFRPGRPTVLCLSRPHFSLDIEQLRRLDRLNWVAINLPILGEIQTAWSAPEMRAQTYFQRTRGVAPYEARWAVMARFGRRLLLEVARRGDLRGILSANIDYWQSEAFRMAAKELELPYLVLSRENLLTRYDDRLVAERYAGFRFTGEACAVFGAWIGETLIRTGCVRRDQIVVTGAPRLDVWIRAVGDEPTRDCIVLLSFADPNYYAPEAFRSCLDRFVAAAARHPGRGVRFVIKAKNREDRLTVRRMCGDGTLSPALSITDSMPLVELLPRARLTIGFNTMALLDALLARTPIVVPDMQDTRRGKEYLMFDPDDPLCREVLSFCHDARELDGALDAAATRDAPPARDETVRRALIERYVHLPEQGTAAEAVERFVIERLGRPPAGRTGVRERVSA